MFKQNYAPQYSKAHVKLNISFTHNIYDINDLLTNVSYTFVANNYVDIIRKHSIQIMSEDVAEYTKKNIQFF